MGGGMGAEEPSVDMCETWLYSMASRVASRANTTLWLRSHVWRCVGHISQMYMCLVASRANTTLWQLRSQVNMCVCG
eukprot:6485217-Amphidinium_carterae.2